MPITSGSLRPTRWLEARSPDFDHPCYAGHQAWATQLATGYAAALVACDAETSEVTEEPFSPQREQQIRVGTALTSAAQLPEGVLDDLENETSEVRS